MKILNFVIGLAVVIVLSGLFTLGLRAFYPMPESPTSIIISSPPLCSIFPRATMSKEECVEDLKAWEERFGITQAEYNTLVDKYNKEVEEYKQKVKTHNRNIFIIGNIVGVLLFITGFALTKLSAKTALAVGVGTVLSGLYAVIAGYSIGWNSTDDRLKFFIGFVIAAIIIGGSLLVGMRHKNKLANGNNSQVPPQIT